MKSYYIYEVITPSKIEGKPPSSFVIIFCPDKSIDEQRLKSEVKEFFQQHILPDDIVVIGGSYLKDDLNKFFIKNASQTFNNINKVHKSHFEDSISVLSFDESGTLTPLKERKQRDEVFYQELLSEGLRKIFTERGGLIESHEAHHFVFPSGKHSSKFLRTGNILLYSPEIYCIAFSMLGKYQPEKHDFILCDTSSINSLAFALAELKSRFNSSYKIPPINSFKSYSIFEEEELAFGGKSLFLVSSSTSGGIIDRLKEKMDSIKKENIILIYFLGEETKYELYKENIICNVTKSASKGGYGLELFKTYKAQDCEHCKNNSSPVNVVGDTFLRERPKINRVLLKKEHAPKSLSDFMQEFMSVNGTSSNIIKCHFKENEVPEEQYDIYFDIGKVVQSLIDEKDNYKEFKKKLYKRINLNIPSNTQYIISLPDDGSEKLAELIKKEFDKTHKSPPDIVKQKDIFNKLSKDKNGSVIIACSSMVNGGNLLYLSRALRDFENLSAVYFISFIRTRNFEYNEFLRKNLSQGTLLGGSNSPFVAVECMYLTDEYRSTTWLHEKRFLERLIYFIEEGTKYLETLPLFKKRLEMFRSVDKVNKGIANELFYPNILNSKQELVLNRNFAFLDFDTYHSHISQADVYFIISVILNDLRYRKIKNETLKQSEYERNILDPGNFLRFNDGIIQAAILRAALPQELQYELDDTCSSQMKDILNDMIRNADKSVSESLMEFVYAIVSNKLKLKTEHKEFVFEKLSMLDNAYISALCNYCMSKKETPVAVK